MPNAIEIVTQYWRLMGTNDFAFSWCHSCPRVHP